MGHDGTCADAMHDALAPARAIEDAERKVVEAAEAFDAADESLHNYRRVVDVVAAVRVYNDKAAALRKAVRALHAARQGVVS
jgi:hypothetical protein